jgi:hypothetical protein
MSLHSDQAAYVSRTPAGRACAIAQLARSMLVEMITSSVTERDASNGLTLASAVDI